MLKWDQLLYHFEWTIEMDRVRGDSSLNVDLDGLLSN